MTCNLADTLQYIRYNTTKLTYNLSMVRHENSECSVTDAVCEDLPYGLSITLWYMYVNNLGPE